MKPTVTKQIREYLIANPELLNKEYQDTADRFAVNSESVRNVARALRRKPTVNNLRLNDDQLCDLLEKFNLKTDLLNDREGEENFLVRSEDFIGMCIRKKIRKEIFYLSWKFWGDTTEIFKELNLS